MGRRPDSFSCRLLLLGCSALPLPCRLLGLRPPPHPLGPAPLQLGRYWNMTRTEYEHLVDLARRDTME